MLTKIQLLKAYLLINTYEFIGGIVVGHFSNELYRRIYKFNKAESLITTIVITFIFIVPLVTFIVYIRNIYTEYVPFLKDLDLKNQENFTHPPPIAFAFGFWEPKAQVKLRNRKMNIEIFKFFK